MRVRIHRGTREIGGTCVEIESSTKQRIVLDVGKPLDALDEVEVALPDIAGLRSGTDPSLLGLFISHGHQDHWGLVDQVSVRVPIYMGEAAANILGAASFFTKTPELSLQGKLSHRQPFTVGPFTVMPFLNDHSAFETYSLLIEADNKKLLYSADFQGHGRKWKIFQEFLRKPPPGVDVMLMEGTNIPTDGAASKSMMTETDVEELCVETFRATEGAVLAIFSGQNIDRLVTMYRACKRADRIFVMDFYLASIARACGNANVPQPDWDDVRVFLPYFQKRRVIRSNEFERVDWVKDARIYPEKFKSMAPELVFAFRTSMSVDLEKADCLEGAAVVWSLWTGYLPRELRLKEFCEKHNIPIHIHHASGHAHVGDLKKYATAVNPSRLVPIHTAAADRFGELFQNVEAHKDGEWWEV